MKDETLFFTVVAVAIGLAGATGVVAAFRQSTTWTIHDHFGVRLIIEYSFGVVFFGLLPSLMYLWFGLDESLRIASLLLVAFCIIVVRFQSSRVIKLKKEGKSPRHPKALLWLGIVPTLIAALIVALNSVAWFHPGAYGFSLLLLVFVAVAQFYVLLLHIEVKEKV